MLLRKRLFVRKITAFSLVLFALFSDPGLAPGSSVFAASVSDLYEKREMLEKEEKELRTALEASAQEERFWLENRLRRLCEGGSDAPLEALLDASEEMDAQEEYAARLKQLEEEKSRLEEEIARWQEERAAAVEAASFNAGGGREMEFIWPVPGFDVITCGFGEGHRGVDISGAGIQGTPILAAESGRVTYSGWLESYGYCVFMEHGDGFSTRYAHAEAVACAVGDVIQRGEVIAYAGNTGYSTGPHLHFEVLCGNALQDPLLFVE